MQPTSRAAMSGGRQSGSKNGDLVRAGAQRQPGPVFRPGTGLDLDGQGAARPKTNGLQRSRARDRYRMAETSIGSVAEP